MTCCLPDPDTLHGLIADIEICAPRPHQAGMLAVVEKRLPDCAFRFALTRGGWYRAGGLIRGDGERLADSLDDWLEQEMDSCSGDLGEFLDRHADPMLLVTRHTGRTHYLVAPYGSDSAEFLQLEVEELQEVVDRALWDADAPPCDVEELSDPIKPMPAPAQVVGAPYYRFRRLTDIHQVVGRLQSPIGGVHPMLRFMREWNASRAGSGNHFSDHWIVALREHHDQYNNIVLSATPVSRHARELKSFHWNDTLHGLDAGRQLQAFDRAAGYCGAWYFHLVSGGLTPRNIAFNVLHDIESGFGYLGDLETTLLFGWLREPYSI